MPLQNGDRSPLLTLMMADLLEVLQRLKMTGNAVRSLVLVQPLMLLPL